VMFAILVFPDQPVNTAVYGNATIAADLAFYRTQIQTLTPAASVPGLPAIGVAALAMLFVFAARRARAARS
jgi:hypothetical protein